MTTLTITDAKRNLGKWLSAAVNGQEVGIVSGATVVALRPVEVEPVDYAWREYGVTPAEIDAFLKRDHARISAARRAGRLVALPGNLKTALEKISSSRSRRAKAAAGAPRKRRR